MAERLVSGRPCRSPRQNPIPVAVVALCILAHLMPTPSFAIRGNGFGSPSAVAAVAPNALLRELLRSEADVPEETKNPGIPDWQADKDFKAQDWDKIEKGIHTQTVEARNSGKKEAQAKALRYELWNTWPMRNQDQSFQAGLDYTRTFTDQNWKDIQTGSLVKSRISDSASSLPISGESRQKFMDSAYDDNRLEGALKTAGALKCLKSSFERKMTEWKVPPSGTAVEAVAKAPTSSSEDAGESDDETTRKPSYMRVHPDKETTDIVGGDSEVSTEIDLEHAGAESEKTRQRRNNEREVRRDTVIELSEQDEGNVVSDNVDFLDTLKPYAITWERVEEIGNMLESEWAAYGGGNAYDNLF